MRKFLRVQVSAPIAPCETFLVRSLPCASFRAQLSSCASFRIPIFRFPTLLTYDRKSRISDKKELFETEIKKIYLDDDIFNST